MHRVTTAGRFPETTHEKIQGENYGGSLYELRNDLNSDIYPGLNSPTILGVTMAQANIYAPDTLRPGHSPLKLVRDVKCQKYQDSPAQQDPHSPYTWSKTPHAVAHLQSTAVAPHVHLNNTTRGTNHSAHTNAVAKQLHIVRGYHKSWRTCHFSQRSRSRGPHRCAALSCRPASHAMSRRDARCNGQPSLSFLSRYFCACHGVCQGVFVWVGCRCRVTA